MTDRYQPGEFCWVGLATSDPVGAKAFYASLFGWHGEDLAAGEVGTYTSLRQEGREIAILYRQTREARAARAAPHWTLYISVEDADASARRAHELGGALLRDPHDLVDAGRVAGLRDPVGGIVSLWQPFAQSGAELTNDLGALCWYELVTLDVEQAKSFYGELLGWRYEGDPSGETTIMNADRPIGAMREGSDREEALTAGGWLPYFLVENVQNAVQKAEQNGGRALAPPTDVPIGRKALLADPQGAMLAILEQPLTV